MRSGNYTSIRRLVLPYESMWGIINKFRLLNHVAPFALKQILKALSDGSLDCDVYPYRLTKWNYSNSLTFRDDLVSSLTAIPIDEMLTHQITSVIDIKDLRWLSSCSSLRFCPSCLAKGYHSIFHQIAFFEKCPIHDQKLKTTCSHCNTDFIYELIDAPVMPFVCSRCSTSIWSRYTQKGGVLIEQLLQFSPNVLTGFKDLFDWLVSLKSSPLIRQRFSETLVHAGPDVPRISVRERYAVWQETRNGGDVPSLAMPLSVSMQHHTVTFGAHISRKELLFCMAYRLGRYSRSLKFGSRWVESKVVNCEDGSKMLGPVYKSIRRHEFKTLIHEGIHCPIPGFASHTIRLPDRCRGCPWAKAYALWRQYWSSRLADPMYFWLDINQHFQDVMHPRVSKWATLWLFALQCLWELRQAIYLIEEQGIRRVDTEKNLRGDFSFTWILKDSPPATNPVFHFWTKSLSYTQKLVCSENEGQTEADK